MTQVLFFILTASSLKAGVLLGSAFLVTKAIRRSSAALRHQIWATALLATLLLPVLQISMPAWHATPPVQVSQILRLAMTVPQPIAVSGDSSMSVEAVAGSGISLSPVDVAIGIWIVGAFVALLRLAAGLFRLRATLPGSRPLNDTEFLATAARCSAAMGVNRPVSLVVHLDPHAMPCTWGLLRPRILLPQSCVEWPDERREMVLAHEIAHIQRFDWPMRLAGELTRAVFWFHPLVWMGLGALHDASECACDDAVLAAGRDPARYAGELLNLVRIAKHSQAAAMAVARPSNLERRFTAMLDNNVNRHRLTRKAALLTSFTALLCLVPLASLRATAQDEAGPFTGTVLDRAGLPVPSATVILIAPNEKTRTMTGTDATGTFRFSDLPAGSYQLRVFRRGIGQASMQHTLEPLRETAETVRLEQDSPEEAEQKMKAERQASGGAPSTIRVAGNVESVNLVAQIHPIYPAEAKAKGIQGQVLLDAFIDREGVPQKLTVVNETDPVLARAAIESVSQWRYRPTLLNGEPVAVETNVTVNFTLVE